MGATDLFHTKSQWRPWLSSRTCHKKKHNWRVMSSWNITDSKKSSVVVVFVSQIHDLLSPLFGGWFFKLLNLTFSSFRNPTIDHWVLWLHLLEHLKWHLFLVRELVQQQHWEEFFGAQVCYLKMVHQKPTCFRSKKQKSKSKKFTCDKLWQMSWSNAPVANKPPSTGIPWVAENRNLQILKSSI